MHSPGSNLKLKPMFLPSKAMIALLLALLVRIPALGQDALSQFMEAARDGKKERVKTFWLQEQR